MSALHNTQLHIIQSAILVLKTHGTEGLTMRKVAQQAGISLGNLQYHFKNKTILLNGLAGYYFSECLSMLDDYQHTPKTGTAAEKLRNLILFMLEHTCQLTDMCRIFREMWAFSTRDEGTRDQLINYYQLSIEKFAKLLFALGIDNETAHSLSGTLLTYFEGYSITVESLQKDKEEIADMLVQMCQAITNTK